jgi:uncharacterized membrane protein YsdA (DUF1294 family)
MLGRKYELCPRFLPICCLQWKLGPLAIRDAILTMVYLAVLLYYLAASVTTACTYGYDKKAAANNWTRVRETTLLLFGLAGGWPGAIVTQQMLRHKTRKMPFQLYFWITVALNLGVLAWLLIAFGPKAP